MSQTDAKSRTIDGHTYKVMMLDPLVASDVLIDIGKVLAPALGAIGGFALGDKDAVAKLLDGEDGAEGEKESESRLSPAFERAVIGLVDRLDKAKLREIVDLLAKVSFLVGSEGEAQLRTVFPVHFRGRLKTMYRWLAFALEVQFADFFETIGPAIGRAARSAGLAQSSSRGT